MLWSLQLLVSLGPNHTYQLTPTQLRCEYTVVALEEWILSQRMLSGNMYTGSFY